MTLVQRLPCRACGELIHPDMAARNDGLCMPCKGGYREQIEAGRLRRVQERERERTPARLYWRLLVDRVHASPQAFMQLPQAERTYYALRCLIGEVFNGGFYGLFANHSGALYGLMVDGLLELEAHRTLGMLTEAKELLLGPGPVPMDHARRDALLPESEFFEKILLHRSTRLHELDQAFWADPEGLDGRCTRYAVAQGLYSAS